MRIAVKILRYMVMEGTAVDKRTFDMLITKCSSNGEMGKAFDLLNTMNSLGILPDGDTYGSIFKGINRT